MGKTLTSFYSFGRRSLISFFDRLLSFWDMLLYETAAVIDKENRPSCQYASKLSQKAKTMSRMYFIHTKVLVYLVDVL